MIVQGDARAIPLGDETVQCVVTSPPYWGLRKYAGEQELVWGNDERGTTNHECGHEWEMERYYTEQTAATETGEGFSKPGQANIDRLKAGRWRETNTCVKCGAWRGGFGLEPTVEMYVEHTVLILREIRRVLRKDGVVFWNVGDSYSAGGRTDHGTRQGYKQETNAGSCVSFRMPDSPGIKPKDLCLIPMRVALAAQADGWWVRSDIIWSKPNPMPESVTDRPTDAYEHILMFTKSARYYWDAEAVKESTEGSNTHYRGTKLSPPSETTSEAHLQTDGKRSHANWSAYTSKILSARNLRNVWEFATQPYKGAHFATFPEELPRRCIRAATSEKGCCAKCGAPWVRVTEPSADYTGKLGSSLGNHGETQETNGKGRGFGERNICAEYRTIGWRAGCECGGKADPSLGAQDDKAARPCLVLDPFGGSGTVAKVAVELGRRAVSLDLAYHELSKKRTRELQPQLMMA